MIPISAKMRIKTIVIYCKENSYCFTIEECADQIFTGVPKTLYEQLT